MACGDHAVGHDDEATPSGGGEGDGDGDGDGDRVYDPQPVELAWLRGRGDGTFSDAQILVLTDPVYALYESRLVVGVPDGGSPVVSVTFEIGSDEGQRQRGPLLLTYQDGGAVTHREESVYDVSSMALGNLGTGTGFGLAIAHQRQITWGAVSPSGTLGEMRSVPTTTMGVPGEILIRDLDSDGHAELIYSERPNLAVGGNAVILWGPTMESSETVQLLVENGSVGGMAARFENDAPVLLVLTHFGSDPTDFMDGTRLSNIVGLKDREPVVGGSAIICGDRTGGVFADFTGNGTTDVLMRCGGELLVFARGTNAGPPRATEKNERYFPRAAADLDGDGDVDIVSTQVDSEDVTVHLNDGGGRFQTGATVRVPGQHQFGSVLLTDIDQDGSQDLLVLYGGDWI